MENALYFIHSTLQTEQNHHCEWFLFGTFHKSTGSYITCVSWRSWEGENFCFSLFTWLANEGEKEKKVLRFNNTEFCKK